MCDAINTSSRLQVNSSRDRILKASFYFNEALTLGMCLATLGSLAGLLLLQLTLVSACLKVGLVKLRNSFSVWAASSAVATDLHSLVRSLCKLAMALEPFQSRV